MREFLSNGINDSENLFQWEDIERLVGWWNERTLTGVKVVSLRLMKLSQHTSSLSTVMPLTEFYLGKYSTWNNPYQYGFDVRKKKKETELKVKRRQKRRRLSNSLKNFREKK